MALDGTLWVEDGKLYFLAFDGCYRVKEDGLSFEKTDRAAPKPAPRKPAASSRRTRPSGSGTPGKM